MHPARSLIGALPIALALSAPAAATAAPADLVADTAAATTIKLTSVTSPPRTATAGQSFTLKGKVTNRRSTSQRATVQVSLSRTKSATPTRAATKTLARIRAGRSAGYTIKVRLPSSLAAGTYYVRTCTAYGKRSRVTGGACKFSTRRITVARPAAPQPAPRRRLPSDAGQTPARKPRPTAPPAQGIDILIFNKGASEDAIETVTAAAEANGYDVDDTELSEAFTANNLKKYRAVVFLTRPATSSTTRSRPRSRPTTRPAAASWPSAPRSAPSRAGPT